MVYRSKFNWFSSGLVLSLALLSAGVRAQSQWIGQTSGRLQQALTEGTYLHLSASAETEVTEDWLVMTLTVQKEGAQAAAVQNQLNAIVAAALLTAKPLLKPGQLELSTGRMNVSPRFDRENKINGWFGIANVILEGRDATQIAALASRLSVLTVSQINWRLSADEQKLAETRIQGEAVDRFKTKAQLLTQQFGMSRYTLAEVSIGSQESSGGFATQRMATMQIASNASPVPTLAGKTQVSVTVKGTVQLHP